MAFDTKLGTLRRDQQFKRLARNKYVTKTVGHEVLYTRHPINPGEFIVWADRGMKWFVRLPAVQLLDVIQPKE